MFALPAAGLAAAMIRSRFGRSEDVPTDTISVLAPLLPDPAPPGVLDYLMPGIEIWEARHQAHIKYEMSAVENMKAKILINIRQGLHMHDVMYCAGWAQEIAGNLAPIDSLISPTLRADLPAWSLESFRWRGKTYGLPSAANPMILFGNDALLANAGIDRLPSNWDELLAAAKALTGNGTFGWTMPAAQTGGTGGLMSHWLVFFLQAGGELFGPNGRPTFVTDAGVAAIDMLKRLLPYCDPGTLRHKSIIDASAVFMRGESAMMFNWAVMHRSFVNPQFSHVADQVSTGTLPAGPAGTASIDSGDGWTIDSRTWVRAKSMELIRYYLEPRVQKQMLTQTGWLPISISALEDADVQAQAPHAKTVRTQLRSRIESGFRPNYDIVTRLIGEEVRAALLGMQTPIEALRSAREQLLDAATTSLEYLS
jgi:ABC-type glycerol-3-phosphate transport system substrate-binding protein